MKAFAGVVAVLLVFSGTSLAQTAPAQTVAAQPTDQTEQTAPAQPIVATPDAVPAPAPAAVRFGPGVKLFVEPMGEFDEFLLEAIAKKKVPVVLVHDRDQADFVLTGDAHVKTPGWLKANFVYLHGQANISIDDAHTGDTVFAYTATRVDANLVDGEVYAIWAGGCANHLKKALRKK